MKDTLYERLLLLSTAQEHMMDVADKMDLWDKSQLIVEKSTFESMNMSDKILNLSIEGNRLIEKIQDGYRITLASFNPDEEQKVITFLEEVKGLFQKILEHASKANDVSHILETQVAVQREIEEGIKNSFCYICENVDLAVARAELVMAEE